LLKDCYLSRSPFI